MRFTTRYFLFTKLRPKGDDYKHLMKEAEKIKAFILYRTDYSDENCAVLKGLIILGGPPTQNSVLARNFRNFLISMVPINFELDFWNLDQDVKEIGRHPYEDIKRNLFKFNETKLSAFMGNERNPGSIRKMVSSAGVCAIRN